MSRSPSAWLAAGLLSVLVGASAHSMAQAHGLRTLGRAAADQSVLLLYGDAPAGYLAGAPHALVGVTLLILSASPLLVLYLTFRGGRAQSEVDAYTIARRAAVILTVAFAVGVVAMMRASTTGARSVAPWALRLWFSVLVSALPTVAIVVHGQVRWGRSWSGFRRTLLLVLFVASAGLLCHIGRLEWIPSPRGVTAWLLGPRSEVVALGIGSAVAWFAASQHWTRRARTTAGRPSIGRVPDGPLEE